MHAVIDWTSRLDLRDVCVVANDVEQRAIETAAHALRIAALLAARIAADQAELRRALERAVAELAQMRRTGR